MIFSGNQPSESFLNHILNDPCGKCDFAAYVSRSTPHVSATPKSASNSLDRAGLRNAPHATQERVRSRSRRRRLTVKPTISNPFNDGTSDSTNTGSPADLNQRMSQMPDQDGKRNSRRNPRKNLAAALAAMQVDLRETDFGWSLDLTPMQAIDALQAMDFVNTHAELQFLVSMEQSAWRDGQRELSIAEITKRLAIPVIHRVNDDQLVLDEISLRQLVSLCQPSRLVVVAVEGAIDDRDAVAMSKAIEAGSSPLLAELRAIAALEVLGDRSIVLHGRDKSLAFGLIADNFRHYLGALNSVPAARFEAPQPWQIERLISLTGMLTIRPIETQQFSTSIDVGINTSKERFTKPADRSLIYDIPSNTWHDEP
jgi:hypothetical protein